MKKVFLLMAMFMVVVLTSCTDSSEENLPNETETQKLSKSENIEALIDPEKDCPPNDRNCNGVPDDEE